MIVASQTIDADTVSVDTVYDDHVTIDGCGPFNRDTARVRHGCVVELRSGRGVRSDDVA